MRRAPLLLASNPPYHPADGVNAPRLDFLELAHAIGGKILYPSHDGWIGQIEEGVGADWRQALGASRRHDVSVYVSLSERVGILLAFLLGRRRVPHVLVAHRLTSKKKRALHRRTGYLHRFDRIVVLCRKQEDYLRGEVNLPAERVHFVHDKVDTRFWRPESAPLHVGERFVLSVGRERRDYETLLAAARMMPDTPFLVVCSSPWARRRDTSLGSLPPNVTVRHSLTWCDLRALYERAAVILVPLLPMTDYAAGVNTVLEAMAMAKPVVVTATPGIADYVAEGETALFVPPSDASALARAIERTFAHPRISAGRAASARQAVEAQNAIEGYVAALTRIISEVRSP
jgi:glycosyltransferase involved in cell wall biosynthesis